MWGCAGERGRAGTEGGEDKGYSSPRLRFVTEQRDPGKTNIKFPNVPISQLLFGEVLEVHFEPRGSNVFEPTASYNS